MPNITFFSDNEAERTSQPSAVDHSLLYKQLKDLKSGKSIEQPIETLKNYRNYVRLGFFKYIKPIQAFADVTLDNSDPSKLEENFKYLKSIIDEELRLAEKHAAIAIDLPQIQAKL